MYIISNINWINRRKKESYNNPTRKPYYGTGNVLAQSINQGNGISFKANQENLSMSTVTSNENEKTVNNHSKFITLNKKFKEILSGVMSNNNLLNNNLGNMVNSNINNVSNSANNNNNLRENQNNFNSMSSNNNNTST